MKISPVILDALMRANFSELLCVGMAITGMSARELSHETGLSQDLIYRYRRFPYQPDEETVTKVLLTMERRKAGTIRKLANLSVKQDMVEMQAELEARKAESASYRQIKKTIAFNGFKDVSQFWAFHVQVNRRLSAAMTDLRGTCRACQHYCAMHNVGPCRTCCYETQRMEGNEVNDNWVWHQLADGGKP